MYSPQKLAAIEAAVIEVAILAGQYLKHEHGRFASEATELKGKNNLVSYVDRQAEAMIMQGLASLVPDAVFLGEETGMQGDESADWMWIVDPLDGTTNFIHGLPLFSVSIALCYQREPVVGVVYEPMREECFSAYTGSGTKLNGVSIHVSSAQQLETSLLATGFPYFKFELMTEYLALLGHLMEATRGMRRMGSAAIDLAYTACGRFEGFFEYNLSPWDVAAGVLLVREAGGTVTAFENLRSPIFGQQIVASNGAIHQALRATIRTYFKIDERD